MKIDWNAWACSLPEKSIQMFERWGDDALVKRIRIARGEISAPVVEVELPPLVEIPEQPPVESYNPVHELAEMTDDKFWDHP